MMHPEPLDYPSTNGTLKPPPYVESVNDIPTLSPVEDDELHDDPPPAYPGSNIHGSCVPTTTTILTTAHSRPMRNQTVRAANAGAQIPDIYPGFAFCKFIVGKIETAIRLTIVVMLLVLISLSGAAIHEEGHVVTDGFLTVDATGWRGVAGWIIFVASTTTIAEGIVLTLRYLNPSCMNNNYSICGGLDVTKCVLSIIGLFIGCTITGAEAGLAADDLNDYCSDNPYNTDDNEACHHLQGIYRLVISVTTFCVVCIILLMILITWDTIYVYNGWNSKVPVPRARNQSNQQRQTQSYDQRQNFVVRYFTQSQL